MHATRVVIILLLMLATARQVLSWVPTGETWPTATAAFLVNASFPTPAGGSSDQQVNAIVAAASAWRYQAQSAFEFEFAGTTGSASSDPFDGENVIRYSPAGGGGGILAVTIRGISGSSMEGFDIVFFGENDLGPVHWNGVGDPSVAEEDIAAVAIHEFGHALGLDHTPVSGATMFGDSIGVEARTLHPDDIDGVRTLYGFDGSVPVGPVIDDVDPPSGDSNGGYEIVISGENFTWHSDTELLVDSTLVDPSHYLVESPGRIRVLAAPPHLPGSVSFQVTNELGTVLLDSAFTYEGPPPTTSGVVSISTATSVAGAENVRVELVAQVDFDLGGYSVGVGFDPTRISIDHVTVSDTDAVGAEFVAPVYDTIAGWWTLSVAMDISPPVTAFIPAGSSRVLAQTFYDVGLSAPEGFATLELASGLGVPAVDIVLANFATGAILTPTTLDGGILIVDGPLFLRGDANRDQAIEVTDAVYHLEWLFIGGPTGCLDAQDTNDDGTLDISDAVYVLSYLFVSGPPPPAPFPDAGVDSTPDALGCSP